jgi:glyoxylase-like metal-dependent hydrolase (beta-lactamase superfamily II)
VGADEDVLRHRHRREEDDVLKGSRDPGPDHSVRPGLGQIAPVENHLPGVRSVETRDDVEEGRFPGPVRTDQAGDRPLFQFQRDIVESDDAPEPQCHVLDCKEGHAATIIRSVVELDDGIRRVTLALPLGIDHVHCYLLPGSDGRWTLVDTGLGLPDAEERWARILAGLDAPIGRVFVTHFHPDHVGAAAIVAELTGALVHQGADDYAQCVGTWGERRIEERMPEYLREHGTPEAEIESFREESRRFAGLVRFERDPVLVAPGNEIDGWELLHLPGHADGHLALLQDGILVAGDTLLAAITPNVGLYPDSRPDPLGDYIESLERIIGLDPRIALPGHHEPIEDPAGRARELIDHHVWRLEQAAEALDADPRTAYDVSLSLFPGELPPVLRRFALAETRAHLEYLVRRGGARRVDADERVSYLASR